MKINENKLREKGWSEKNISHAKGIISHAQENKHPKIKFLEKATEWIILLIIILGSVAGAWLVEPLLFVLNQTQALIAIAILGSTFGLFASTIIKQIEDIETHHHLIIILTIPITAIITSIVITKQVHLVIEAAKMGLEHNPYWLGIVYTIFALIPYGIFVYIQRREHGTL
jgi:hypothetical protein